MIIRCLQYTVTFDSSIFDCRLNNALSVDEVDQFGEPVITLILVGIVVKLVFGSHNILVLLKFVTQIWGLQLTKTTV